MSSEFTIKSKGEEAFDVYLDDEFVIGVNHDDHGWDGMSAVRTTVERIADIISAKVVDEDGEKE